MSDRWWERYSQYCFRGFDDHVNLHDSELVVGVQPGRYRQMPRTCHVGRHRDFHVELHSNQHTMQRGIQYVERMYICQIIAVLAGQAED